MGLHVSSGEGNRWKVKLQANFFERFTDPYTPDSRV